MRGESAHNDARSSDNRKHPISSQILDRLEPQFDSIVEAVYRAGSGLQPWLHPLAQIAAVFDAWSVQLLGVNKLTGVMSFSYEAGAAPPAAPLEYVRYYHRIDPRLEKHLPAPVGTWFACEEHFDDAFVENNAFYQDYLIPFGGRYLYGAKLHDDESSTVLLGHLSLVGRPPMSPAEKGAFARLASHIAKAFDITRELANKSDRESVGAEILERIRQPMILIDSHRRITYRNRNATHLLARKDLVFEQDGQLVCRDPESDNEMTMALRELALVPISNHGDMGVAADRRAFRLRRRSGPGVAATLLALRPEATLGSFGRAPQALFTLFEPSSAIDIDPYLIAMTFGLTPAEARLAAMLVNGRAPEDCARELNVKISTVRTQLASVYRKTGAAGQPDLIRLVLSATAI